MSFPAIYPNWMWLYFGGFGSAGLVLFALIGWNWMKLQARTNGKWRVATRWLMAGFVFLFFAAWFSCGVGGTPGALLSHDEAVRSTEMALVAAVLSMFFSVPGWACVLVGVRRMVAAVQ
jgi:hypothetical protein